MCLQADYLNDMHWNGALKPGFKLLEKYGGRDHKLSIVANKYE